MIFEIIGVAGTGKSTISGALCQANSQVECLYDLRSWQNLPALAWGSATVLPFAWRERTTARVTRQEWGWLARLQALPHIVQQNKRAGQISVLDQGPLYTLARLSETAIWRGQSARVAKRKEQIFRHWSKSLAGVIWLDAPTGTLFKRIAGRDKAHAVRAMPEAKARAWLERHKELYTETVGQLTREGGPDGGPPIYRFDTEKMGPEEIVDALCATFDGLSAQEWPAVGG